MPGFVCFSRSWHLGPASRYTSPDPKQTLVKRLLKPLQAITAYSPVLLSQAGYSEITQNGLAGGINTIGILGTIISAQILDRFGRRPCLMLGSAVLCTVELIVSRERMVDSWIKAHRIY